MDSNTQNHAFANRTVNRLRYVVDIGSSYTSIYQNGTVLNQPTAALIRRNHRNLELIAAGSDVFKYLKNRDPNTDIVNPMRDGQIVYPEAASLMLRAFFKRVVPRTFFKGAEIIVAIPSGITNIERDTYERAIIKSGYSDVFLIESIYGLWPVIKPNGQLVIIIGSGITDIGILTKAGIISACSINLGGRRIDELIAEHVAREYATKISLTTAESLKMEIGNFNEGDTSFAEIMGRDLITGEVKKISVSAASIKLPIKECYAKLIDVAESLLTTIPDHLLPAIAKNGIYLAGGGANMNGLDDFITKRLKISSTKDPDPKIAVARGLYSISKL
ncbi:MAG: rod shape-determining protein [Christensenellaceae bacterium]|jgi:rod shape-determining protein MreB|nr:rod shape-determining protein [Christensenellaceae bacterium]